MHKSKVNALKFDPTQQFLYSGGDDGIIMIRDLQRGQNAYTLIGKELAITSIGVSGGGKYFIVGYQSEFVALWENQEISGEEQVHLKEGGKEREEKKREKVDESLIEKMD